MPSSMDGNGTKHSDWNMTEHLPWGDVIVQGHRGVGDLAEENTIEAFELAWQMSIYPESDLRMTRDGVIVPFHDPDFSRVVQDASPELKTKGVEDVTLAELVQLDVGSWKGAACKDHHVVPMTAIFELMRGRPDRHLYMDIKQIEFSRLAAEVRHFGLERQVVLASRNIAHLCEWKTLVPESDTLLWVHGNETDIRRDFTTYRQNGFRDITQLQIHVYPKVTNEGWAPPADASPADNPFRLRNAFLREIGDELRNHGVLYQTYAVTSDPGVFSKLMDLGVMSFATDHPDLALHEIKAYYARKLPTRCQE